MQLGTCIRIIFRKLLHSYFGVLTFYSKKFKCILRTSMVVNQIGCSDLMAFTKIQNYIIFYNNRYWFERGYARFRVPDDNIIRSTGKSQSM